MILQGGIPGAFPIQDSISLQTISVCNVGQVPINGVCGEYTIEQLIYCLLQVGLRKSHILLEYSNQ